MNNGPTVRDQFVTLDGVRILQPETVAWATAIEVDGDHDRTLANTVRRGLGFDLGGLAGFLQGAGTATTAATFGHGGAGTVICWGDSDLDVAMAYMVNGFRADEVGLE